MATIGVGVDVVEIDRFAESLRRRPRLAERCFTDDEQDYRSFLMRNGWCRVLPIADLTPGSFAAVLAEIEPLQENPLDTLAAKLKDRLPELF